MSPKNLFWFSRYLNFCPDIFGHIGERFNRKAKANFEIYDVSDWETIN